MDDVLLIANQVGHSNRMSRKAFFLAVRDLSVKQRGRWAKTALDFESVESVTYQRLSQSNAEIQRSFFPRVTLLRPVCAVGLGRILGTVRAYREPASQLSRWDLIEGEISSVLCWSVEVKSGPAAFLSNPAREI